jgi:hypothetical protein
LSLKCEIRSIPFLWATCFKGAKGEEMSAFASSHFGMGLIGGSNFIECSVVKR